jgi:hypothetical protein
MSRAATSDEMTMTVPACGPRPAPSNAVRWTLPVNGDLPQAIYACVAGAYAAWGTAEHQADLLADLAADFIAEVLDAEASPYITVTAMLRGIRATLSVIPAKTPAPPAAVPLPHQEATTTMESSWGHIQLACGLCAYATVNLKVRRRRRDR